ncbi:MAG: M20 family metallo-hydrolase [Lewinella sp.]|nr:M20 family metallo-hydrolase [Lewinella sp.]
MATAAFSPTLTAVIELLESLIRTPSLSREEADTAALLESFLINQGFHPARRGNNVWARQPHWREGLPVVLLNSHHDTVKPNAGWQRDPFTPTWEGDQLFGLGSNDAGGPLVALVGAFCLLKDRTDLPFNLLLAATAEEEISGAGGVASILPELGPISCGIVGEPTSLDVAVAERGLIVIDGEAQGQAGHAARNEGVNALYLALDDIQRLRAYEFPKTSELLGPVKVTVTQITAGSQHNVVPDRCLFVIDVRVNEHYANQDVVSQLQRVVTSTLTPRSLRLQSSGIDPEHPLARAAQAAGLRPYGSPTLSDQALLAFPTIKLGPGDSARSHTADEYIRRSEIEAGIQTYLRVLEQLYT